jgi:hypothetical protein
MRHDWQWVTKPSGWILVLVLHKEALHPIYGLFVPTYFIIMLSLFILISWAHAAATLLDLGSDLVVDPTQMPRLLPQRPYHGTHTVNPGDSLRVVLEHSVPGDVILVSAGTYYEGSWDSSFALDMVVPNVTLAAHPAGAAVLIRPTQGGPTIKYGLNVRASNIIVDGLDLAGFDNGVVYVGSEGGSSNLVLSNLKLTGGYDGIRSAWVASPPEKPIVNGLLVYNTTITDSVIGFNCGEGPCTNVRLENVVVRGSVGEGSGADGIAVESGHNVVLVNCMVTGVGADGIDIKAGQVAVVNSVVESVGRNGIKLWRGGDVVNCLVHDTGADGAVILSGPGDYRILHTTVAGTGRQGGYVMTVAYDHPGEPGTLLLANSIFWDNAAAIYISSSFDVMIESVLFGKSGNGRYVDWKESSYGQDIYQSAKQLSRATGGGKVWFDKDPHFQDGNFRLSPSSKARHRGADLSSLVGSVASLVDLDGNPRSQLPDLGPYES